MARWFVITLGVVTILVAGYFVLGQDKSGIESTIIPSTESSPTGGIQQEGETSSEEVAVTLTSSGFSPANVTIMTGAKVTWTNKSGEAATVSSDPHPAHTDYPPLNLGSFTNGSSFSLIFDKPGTYGYHNHFNASQKGMIIVQ